MTGQKRANFLFPSTIEIRRPQSNNMALFGDQHATWLAIVKEGERG